MFYCCQHAGLALEVSPEPTLQSSLSSSPWLPALTLQEGSAPPELLWQNCPEDLPLQGASGKNSNVPCGLGSGWTADGLEGA